MLVVCQGCVSNCLFGVPQVRVSAVCVPPDGCQWPECWQQELESPVVCRVGASDIGSRVVAVGAGAAANEVAVTLCDVAISSSHSVRCSNK